MTVFKFITLLVIIQGGWLSMCFVMRSGKATPKRLAIIVLCFAAIIGAFVLGAHWNHTDFTCHPGQHCFPWGD